MKTLLVYTIYKYFYLVLKVAYIFAVCSDTKKGLCMNYSKKKKKEHKTVFVHIGILYNRCYLLPLKVL